MNAWHDDDLRAQHLLALREGRAAQVLRAGDAEGLLWEAPRHRVVHRFWHGGGARPVRSELRALLGADGRPLVWWQRSAAPAWPARAFALPATIEHRSVHEITLAPGAAPLDAGIRIRAVAFFVDRLAEVAGCDPLAYRSRWWPDAPAPLAAASDSRWRRQNASVRSRASAADAAS